MPRKLSTSEATATFSDLVAALPKQHLRFQFRKRFGAGELLDPKMLKKGTSVVDRGKPATNILQEVPEKLVCTRFTGSAEDLRAEEWTATPDVALGDLFSPEEVEQALIVQGRKARLYVYADPTEETVYALRVVTEVFGEEETVPPPRRVRRAATPARKPRPRSRR